MKVKAIAAAVLSAMLIRTGVNAQVYTVAYYDSDNALIDVIRIERDKNTDVSEYVDFYAPYACVTGRVYTYSGGEIHCDTVNITDGADKMSYTEKAPNVTDNMCDPQYWIKGDCYGLILSSGEIEKLNSRILNDENTMMNDLKGLDETYDGKEMSKLLSGFKSPEGLYIDGKSVPESYYEAIRKNISGAKCTSNDKVKYGICTERTVMKAYPYDGWISDSSWDKEWDEFVNTAVLVGEPLVLYSTTADGEFIYAKCACCEGWIKTEDVAVCKSRDEWLRAQDHKSFLVVTGEKVWLEASYDEDLSNKQLAMGTILELGDGVEFDKTNRLSWNNYVVKLPVRNSDGSYGEKEALISANRDVSIGYLPYTRENIVKQAFKSLGNRYGWGGMLDSQDCSSYVREVYQCFGIVLPRNTTWQAAMPVKSVDMSKMTDEEKRAELDKTPVGAILLWSGHEMIYLGEDNGLYYTINDVSSLVSPEDPGGGVIRPRSVIINDLSTLRANGTTWLSNLTTVKVVE